MINGRGGFERKELFVLSDLMCLMNHACVKIDNEKCAQSISCCLEWLAVPPVCHRPLGFSPKIPDIFFKINLIRVVTVSALSGKVLYFHFYLSLIPKSEKSKYNKKAQDDFP